MPVITNEEIERIVLTARQQLGGKPAKYTRLDKYDEAITLLLERDVQLPAILRWLVQEKNEDMTLNTLRKFVIYRIGREEYEKYLKRNGWLKNTRARRKSEADLAATPDWLHPKAKQPENVNPLRKFSGNRKSGEFGPIPKHTVEIEKSKKG